MWHCKMHYEKLRPEDYIDLNLPNIEADWPNTGQVMNRIGIAISQFKFK